MIQKKNQHLNYEEPIEIAEGVFWIGFYDQESGLHCNPYLIVDGDEALVIDGGSRPDFPTVMMKILHTGIEPKQIKTLIYHHYDPDLCASISNFESIIDSKELQIISHSANNMFIRHYAVNSPINCFTKDNSEFIFESGRKLKFINTPYSHSQGSFATYDEKTKIVFSSDLFGSYAVEWDLFLELDKTCYDCQDHCNCYKGKTYCPLNGITNFHQKIMTSTKALRMAINRIMGHNLEMIAPQHGSIIHNDKDIKHIASTLLNLDNVGIDSYSDDKQEEGGLQ